MSLPASDFRRSLETPEQTANARHAFHLFENFKLDLATASLYRDGREVELRRKNFDLLFYLINNRGRLITKDECLERVWPDCVVSENVLTQGIAEFRKVLGDDPHQPNFIKTVPRRGYIFIADVRTAQERRDDELVTGSEARGATHGAAPLQARRNTAGAKWLFISTLTVAFLGAALVWPLLPFMPTTGNGPSAGSMTRVPACR